MINLFTSIFSRKKAVAAAPSSAMPQVEQDIKPPGKLKPNQQTPLVFLGASKNMLIANPARDTTNLDLASVRSNGSVFSVIRELVKISPDLSQAVATRINSAISDTFTVYACTLDGQVDPQGTTLLHAILARMNFMSPDYTQFNQTRGLRSLSESLLMDDIRYGAMMLELVLGKSRLPLYMKHVPTSGLYWQESNGGVFPVIVVMGKNIELNFPTIFYTSAFQDGETGYSDSQIEAAIQPVLFEEEFKGDLRRAVRNVILPRLKIVIDSEAWRKSVPADIQQDSVKMKAHMDATLAALEAKLDTMNPEDAIVEFDVITSSYMTHGNISTDKDISVLSELLSGNVASGAKTLPAVLGKSQTQGAGSAESMIFMKGVEAAQTRLNDLYSRVLTLAVRLYGLDVYVKFKFDEVNLRPQAELEAFKAMKQSRHLQLLSLGMQTDEETCIELTGHLPPAGYKPLCGTGFNNADPSGTGNPYSNTSVDPGNVSDTTIGKKTKSDAPQAPKGGK